MSRPVQLTSLALLLASAVGGGMSARAQGMLPLDMEALFCLGAIPVAAADADASFREVMSASGMSADQFRAASSLEEKQPLLARLRLYAQARGLSPSASIVAGLIGRGQAQAKRCTAATKRLSDSACNRNCVSSTMAAPGGNIEAQLAQRKSCAASCPSALEQAEACGKVNSCLSVGDRLPF